MYILCKYLSVYVSYSEAVVEKQRGSVLTGENAYYSMIY